LVKPAPTFEKPLGQVGRPREDRYSRQLEIFRSVAPLLERTGVRGLTMQAAARAACVSIGTLYHYFSTKRDLVLFPLREDVCTEGLQRFQQMFSYLKHESPDRYVEAFVNFYVQGVFMVRPALRAALELGVPDFWRGVEAGLATELDQFIAEVRQAGAALAHDSHQLGRTVRRLIFSALFDRSVTLDELRDELQSLLLGRPLS
jgi:AcrR family transcriptional regulator